VPKKTEQEYFMSDKTKTKSVVAIIGATGYTGRFIIAELAHSPPGCENIR
jgi:hypothetical protein